MSYAEQLRAALTPIDWAALNRLAEAAARGRVAGPIYLVGGPVRDCLLGRAVVDFDLTVDGDAIALARTLQRELGGALTTHTRFGTATWCAPDQARSIDLATARTETYPRPGALPEVARGTIETDLIRRDFTLNALALRLDGDHFGELIDLHGGERDLRAGRVRVLHPRSFNDDPTRLFRAARIEQRFDFTVEAETLNLMPTALPVLDQVSGDRLRHELELIFQEARPVRALRRLDEWGVLRQIDPALHVADRAAARLAGTLESFAGWAYWLADLPLPDLRRIAVRLNLRRAAAIDLEQLAGLLDQAESIGQAATRHAVYHRLTPYHDRTLRAALNLIEPERARLNIELYLNELRDVRPELAGAQLQALGLPPGPALGRLLRDLRDACLDGTLATRPDEEDYARQWIAHEAETHGT
jgi:tRNA nucleotidyltransferase (CCA-adding enzyme)